MKYFVFALVTSISSLATAGGCPPWLPCGKYNNLIIADPEYGSVVAASIAGVVVGTSALLPDPAQMSALTKKIQTSESEINRLNPSITLNMMGDGKDAQTQQNLLRFPQSTSMGYDWGKPSDR